MVVTRTDRITDKVRTDKIDIGDITDTSYQYSLIEDYLKRNHLPSDETLVKIKKLNEEINGIIQGEDVTRNINWTLKKFEWSNMFSYGEDNVIDFTKLNGIVGMFVQTQVVSLLYLMHFLFVYLMIRQELVWLEMS